MDPIEINIDMGGWSEKGIPFGKYAYLPLCDVPTRYLAWFLEEVEDRDNGLHEVIEEELWIRGDRE